MRYLYVLVLIVLAPLCGAQTAGNAQIVLFPAVPTGTCHARQLAIDQSNGQLYTCVNAGTSVNGSWQIVSGSGTTLNGCATPSPGNLNCTNTVTAGTSNQGIVTLAYSTLPVPPTTTLSELAVNNAGSPMWSVGTTSPFQPVMLGQTSNGLLSGLNIDISKNTGGLGNTVVLRTDFTNCNTSGWNIPTAMPTCADLRLNSQPLATYTLLATDENTLLQNTLNGAVINTLPLPVGSFAAPFVFWMDTNCASSVTLTAATGSQINSRNTLPVGACGWAMIWADANGVDWHAQVYDPPGGVVTLP